MQNQEYLDRRIDLGDLIKIILNKKFFILGLTFLFTLIAVVYVSIKTPIYQVKALVEVGSYKNSEMSIIQLEETNQLVKKVINNIYRFEKK